MSAIARRAPDRSGARGGAARLGKDAIKTALRRVGYDIVPYPQLHGLEAHLAALFRHFEINCVLDVGAHEGEFGRSLRRLGYLGRIVSFEPVAATCAVLRQAARGDRRWRVHQLALGDVPGRQTLRIAPGNTNLNSFLTMTPYGRDVYNRGRVDDRLEEVRVERLDGVLEHLLEGIAAPRIYLKVDAQGYDMRVIRGAAGWLERVPALQTEMSVRPIYEGMTPYQEAIAELEGLGFALSALFPVSVAPDMRLTEFDCVMVRDRG